MELVIFAVILAVTAGVLIFLRLTHRGQWSPGMKRWREQTRSSRPHLRLRAWGGIALLLLAALIILRSVDRAAFKVALLAVYWTLAGVWVLAMLIATIAGPTGTAQGTDPQSLRDRIVEVCRTVFWVSP